MTAMQDLTYRPRLCNVLTSELISNMLQHKYAVSSQLQAVYS